jgi:hypothetical protein
VQVADGPKERVSLAFDGISVSNIEGDGILQRVQNDFDAPESASLGLETSEDSAAQAFALPGRIDRHVSNLSFLG